MYFLTLFPRLKQFAHLLFCTADNTQPVGRTWFAEKCVVRCDIQMYFVRVFGYKYFRQFWSEVCVRKKIYSLFTRNLLNMPWMVKSTAFMCEVASFKKKKNNWKKKSEIYVFGKRFKKIVDFTKNKLFFLTMYTFTSLDFVILGVPIMTDGF